MAQPLASDSDHPSNPKLSANTVHDERPSGPKPVSQWFNLDWQYVLTVSRLPALRPATLILAVMPILLDFSKFVPVNLIGFWLLWIASVPSLVALTITRWRCPALVREYESFEKYVKAGHSHRWIGWLFHIYRDAFGDRNGVTRETVEKLLAFPADAPPALYGLSVCPVDLRARPSTSRGAVMLRPVNIDRDLYLSFWIDGRRYVMPLKENDPELAEKTKELFWIMYSDLAKSRAHARATTWLFYGASGLFVSAAIALNVFKVVRGFFCP